MKGEANTVECLLLRYLQPMTQSIFQWDPNLEHTQTTSGPSVYNEVNVKSGKEIVTVSGNGASVIVTGTA